MLLKSLNGLHNGNLKYDSKHHEQLMRNPQPVVLNSNTDPNLSHHRNHDLNEHRGGHSGRGNWGLIGNNVRGFKSTPTPSPPGFSSYRRGWDMNLGSNDDDRGIGCFQRNHDKAMGGHSNFWDRSVNLTAEADRLRGLSIQNESKFNLSQQIDHPANSLSMLNKEARGGRERKEELGQLSQGKREGNGNCGPGDDFGEDIVESLLLEVEADDKEAKDGKKNSKASREKEPRMDNRGRWLLSQRLRKEKMYMACRNDIHRYDASFIAVYKSLIPVEEELEKQRQLMAQLQNLVAKEWPHAKFYLYGSCANSFGFPNSDIVVCLAIEDDDINKSEML